MKRFNRLTAFLILMLALICPALGQLVFHPSYDTLLISDSFKRARHKTNRNFNRTRNSLNALDTNYNDIVDRAEGLNAGGGPIIIEGDLDLGGNTITNVGSIYTTNLFAEGPVFIGGDLDMGGSDVTNLNDIVFTDGMTIDERITNVTDALYLQVDGGNKMLADADAGGFGVTNMLDPTDPQDAVTLNYMTNYVDGLVFGASHASNWSHYVAVSNVDLAGYALTNVDMLIPSVSAGKLSIAGTGGTTMAYFDPNFENYGVYGPALVVTNPTGSNANATVRNAYGDIAELYLDEGLGPGLFLSRQPSSKYADLHLDSEGVLIFSTGLGRGMRIMDAAGIDMFDHPISNLQPPVVSGDAVNLGYLTNNYASQFGASNWSFYVATQSVDFAENTITNVSHIDVNLIQGKSFSAFYEAFIRVEDTDSSTGGDIVLQGSGWAPTGRGSVVITNGTGASITLEIYGNTYQRQGGLFMTENAISDVSKITNGVSGILFATQESQDSDLWTNWNADLLDGYSAETLPPNLPVSNYVEGLVAGLHPSNWSYYAALQNVDFGGFDLTNAGSIVLEGGAAKIYGRGGDSSLIWTKPRLGTNVPNIEIVVGQVANTTGDAQSGDLVLKAGDAAVFVPDTATAGDVYIQPGFASGGSVSNHGSVVIRNAFGTSNIVIAGTDQRIRLYGMLAQTDVDMGNFSITNINPSSLLFSDGTHAANSGGDIFSGPVTNSAGLRVNGGSLYIGNAGTPLSQKLLFDYATGVATVQVVAGQLEIKSPGGTHIGTQLAMGGPISMGGSDVTNAGHWIPSADDTYDVGSPARRVRDIYVTPGTIYMGTNELSTINGFLTINSNQVPWVDDGGNQTTVSNLYAFNTVVIGGDVVDTNRLAQWDIVRGLMSCLSIGQPELALAISGSTITGVITEATGATNLVYYFDGVPYPFDMPAYVGLYPGSAVQWQQNFIYVTTNGFESATARPTGERAIVFTLQLLTAALTDMNGPLGVQRVTEMLQGPDDRSRVSHMGERLRLEAARWEAGVTLSAYVTTDTNNEDSVLLSTTAGYIWQMHRQTWGATSTNDSEYWALNDPTGLAVYTNLNQITLDANSNAVLNTDDNYFNVQILAHQNSGLTSAVCRLLLLLSTGSYSTEAAALTDSSDFSVTHVAQELLGSVAWIGTITLNRLATNNGTWSATVTDRRGLYLSGGGSGAGASAQATSFDDAVFRVYDDADGTKLIAFQASGITANNTRTLTAQDSDGTIAYLSDIVGYEGFLAYPDEGYSQSISPGLSKLWFSNEVWDVGTTYDASLSRWTPGELNVRCSVVVRIELADVEQNDWMDVFLYRNGAEYKKAFRVHSPSANTDVAGAGTIEFLNHTATNYYELYIYNGDASADVLWGGITNNQFSGEILR